MGESKPVPGPDLSVIIPCHDTGELLRDAVQSVLDRGSEGPTLEVVVVDDRSTDRPTLDLLQELRTIRHVTVIDNVGQPGPAGARNTGIRQASGRWIIFLDSDDLMLPGSVSSRWKVVLQCPEAKFIAGDTLLWFPEEGRKESWFDHLESTGAYRSQVQEARISGKWLHLDGASGRLAEAEMITTLGVMAKTSILRELGGFRESLRAAEDTHLWIRLGAVSDLYFVPEPVALYRQRPGSVTKSGQEPVQYWGRLAFESLMTDPLTESIRPQIRRRLAKVNRRLSRSYYRSGRWIDSILAAFHALKWQPVDMKNWRLLAGLLVPSKGL